MSQNCKLRHCCLKSLGRKSTRKNNYFNHKENMNWCLKWEGFYSSDVQIKSRDKKLVWISRLFLLISTFLACSSLFLSEILILLQWWIWQPRSMQSIFFLKSKHLQNCCFLGSFALKIFSFQTFTLDENNHKHFLGYWLNVGTKWHVKRG